METSTGDPISLQNISPGPLFIAKQAAEDLLCTRGCCAQGCRAQPVHARIAGPLPFNAQTIGKSKKSKKSIAREEIHNDRPAFPLKKWIFWILWNSQGFFAFLTASMWAALCQAAGHLPPLYTRLPCPRLAGTSTAQEDCRESRSPPKA